MKTRLYNIFFLILLTAFSCQKKKYPQPNELTDSVFYARLLVNGQPLDLITGKDDYYMYSSYALDSSNVYNLIGEFKQTNCSNCANRLRIQINDSRVSSAGNSIKIDSALQTGNYGFLAGAAELGYAVNFSGSFNKTYSSVLWNFGDGSTSTAISPTHIFVPGKYPVSLTIKNPDLCQSSVLNTLSFFSANDLNGCITSSSVSKSVSFNSNVMGGVAPYTYSWDFGDGGTSSLASPTHTYHLSGSYAMKLTVTDAQGRTAVCNYNAVTATDLSTCAANFSFGEITFVDKRLGLSKVSIQFTDANGTTFTSDNASQPSASSLEIISMEEFVKNENNQPVKKVKMKFNCTLYNGSQSVSLQGTEVVVGLAYK